MKMKRNVIRCDSEVCVIIKKSCMSEKNSMDPKKDIDELIVCRKLRVYLKNAMTISIGHDY